MRAEPVKIDSLTNDERIIVAELPAQTDFILLSKRIEVLIANPGRDIALRSLVDQDLICHYSSPRCVGYRPTVRGLRARTNLRRRAKLEAQAKGGA